MKTLLLMRHAKSSWDDAGLADRDRPLAPRGRKAAPRIARRLAADGLVPDLVLHSDAVRARQTWQAMAAELPASLPVRELRSLYPGSPSRVLGVLQHLPAEAARVLVIGHNPGLQSLAGRLVGTGDAALVEALGLKFPTAAVAVIEFAADTWPDLETTRGRLAAFLRPKELD